MYLHQPVSLSHSHSLALYVAISHSLSLSPALPLSPIFSLLSLSRSVSLSHIHRFRFSICRCGRIVDLLIMNICKQQMQPPLASRFIKCSRGAGRRRRGCYDCYYAAITVTATPIGYGGAEHVNCIKPLASAAQHTLPPPSLPPHSAHIDPLLVQLQQRERERGSCGREGEVHSFMLYREIKKESSIEIFLTTRFVFHLSGNMSGGYANGTVGCMR